MALVESEVAELHAATNVLAVALPDNADPRDTARLMTEFFGPLVPGQLGCVFDHAAKDLVVGHIDVTENLIAGTGFLFAPAVVALADTCAAIGCGNNIPEGASFTTIELKSNFLSSARPGERVTCRCEPAHLGRQTHVWDATVMNESTGRSMALFRCTQMVLQAQHSSP
jgi:1,4-dihydroxy-2-naphthoyl-CoA hydrolase